MGAGSPAAPAAAQPFLNRKKMKFEMPTTFTDHPLSRKVQLLKSYATRTQDNFFLMPLAGTGIVRR